MTRSERYRNIRHAEYELLTALLSDEVLLERLHAILRSGVPKGDSVALDRANKALSNTSAVLRGMRMNRVKNLPDWHIDSEAES
jgi:hypothetical protein